MPAEERESFFSRPVSSKQVVNYCTLAALDSSKRSFGIKRGNFNSVMLIHPPTTNSKNEKHAEKKNPPGVMTELRAKNDINGKKAPLLHCCSGGLEAWHHAKQCPGHKYVTGNQIAESKKKNGVRSRSLSGWRGPRDGAALGGTNCVLHRNIEAENPQIQRNKPELTSYLESPMHRWISSSRWTRSHPAAPLMEKQTERQLCIELRSSGLHRL